MRFGSTRDAALLQHIGRELLGTVIEEECLIYKVNLKGTLDNIYGEAEKRSYFQPIRLTCLIKKDPQQWSTQEYGLDLNRKLSFAFFKNDCVDLGIKPEPGDIVEWNRDYFEIDSTVENQYLLGKDPWYRLEDGTGGTQDLRDEFGYSVSIVCNTHMTRYSKLNLVNIN